MGQAALPLIPKLLYSADGFFLHSGIRDDYERLFLVLQEEGYVTCFLSGKSRYGKTHLSIKLSNDLLRMGRIPTIVEGASLTEFIEKGGERSSYEVIIVDNAHDYFNVTHEGMSGPFVSFVERLRICGAKIIYLSDQLIDEISSDDHVKSRLSAGGGYNLSSPSEADMEQIIFLIAKQRGMSLTLRQINFIIKRVRRDIPSIEGYFVNVDRLSQVLGERIKFSILGDAI